MLCQLWRRCWSKNTAPSTSAVPGSTRWNAWKVCRRKEAAAMTERAKDVLAGLLLTAVLLGGPAGWMGGIPRDGALRLHGRGLVWLVRRALQQLSHLLLG